MKIAIIGRSEVLFDTLEILLTKGYEIPLIITHKEAPEYLKTHKDFEDIAQKINAEFIYTNKIADYNDVIKKHAPDIGISLNFPTVIPASTVDLFPLGILNAHGGDLPRYRGNACQAWAIINGEDKVGLCIHKIVGGKLDSGDVIERDYYPINIHTKIGEILQWMRGRVPLMFCNAIEKLKINRNYILFKQDESKSMRCYPLGPDDARIDINKSNIEILRWINAFNKPYAGAYVFYNGQKIIIWDAEVYEDGENYSALPGQISIIDKEKRYVVVITGNGKLKINLIETNGFFGPPADLIKSIRIRIK